MKQWIIMCLLVGGLTFSFLAYQRLNLPREVAPTFQTSSSTASSPEIIAGDAECCLVPLAPHPGEKPVDREIRRWQTLLETTNSPALMERLGWAYVAKARASFDPGFYKIAEQCALCLHTHTPGTPEVLLLQGHVLHNLHQFKQAEAVARELVQKRGLAFDHGLLGDALMELGQLNEAAAEYQKMIDLRPDLHSYARGAQMRWLKGDLDGAVELMELATSASSPLDSEPAAWVWTRLATYQFQNEGAKQALRDCERALALRPDYPPALLLRGRVLLADGATEDAVGSLRRAAELNPLPEYQWTLAEALREDGRPAEAAVVEGQLRRDGARTDPRTYALFLATQKESVPTALRLAQEELEQRGDVFTHDALSWSLAAAGRSGEAWDRLQQALKEGTKDGRLFYHATVIAAQTGQTVEAERYFERAADFWAQLLPSEQAHLEKTMEELGRQGRGQLLSSRE